MYIDHIAIWTNDLTRIEIMKRVDISDGNDKARIGLAHFEIVVGTNDQVHSLIDILEKEGVLIESYPRTTGDGYYESVILDPDNNRIELTAIKIQGDLGSF